MDSCLGEKEALIELEKGYDEAKEVLNNSDKMERFLQRLERKLKIIPLAGEKLAAVPVMASLIKSYVKKEYTDVPIGTIIAVISALTYVISPIDLIPDSIPVLGYFDDAAVVAACWKLVESDIEEYTQWREKNNKVLDV
jgi:uncharacterized membrane protein YkvA (DUF1232 family)